jgi:hypothetical protein
LRPIYQQHFEKADQVRHNTRREHCEQLIQAHSERSWGAAAWWLEHACPERYALKDVPNRSTPSAQLTDQPAREVIMTVPPDEFEEFKAMEDTRVINATQLEHTEEDSGGAIVRMTINLWEPRETNTH